MKILPTIHLDQIYLILRDLSQMFPGRSLGLKIHSNWLKMGAFDDFERLFHMNSHQHNGNCARYLKIRMAN